MQRLTSFLHPARVKQGWVEDSIIELPVPTLIFGVLMFTVIYLAVDQNLSGKLTGAAKL